MDRLPGFRDFYPEPVPESEPWSAEVRQELFASWRRVARRYGFFEYDGPPLEPIELYTAKSGEEIVRQLYDFVDKGERRVALRPEMTPTLARMAAARERNYRKPLKWFAIPQLFRYERQQKGRLREHFQFNADILGERDAGADAELIALLIDSLRELGLSHEDFVIRMSSREAWSGFYRQHGGDPAREYEFFQVVDKLERDDKAATELRLSEVGMSLGEVQGFIGEGSATDELQKVLDNLEARGLREYVKVDYAVVRGLAYYTGPVYEAFDRQGTFRAIAGGGRYDQLVKLISGGKVDLPALGFGMGDVVVTELLRQRGKLPKRTELAEVFCLIESENLRASTLGLVQRLREGGRVVEYPMTPIKADKQFKRALELGARYSVVLEPGNGGRPQVRLKELATRIESVLSIEETVSVLIALPPAKSFDTPRATSNDPTLC